MVFGLSFFSTIKFSLFIFLAHDSITLLLSHRHKTTAQPSSYSYTNYKTQYRPRRTVHLEARWYQNGR